MNGYTFRVKKTQRRSAVSFAGEGALPLGLVCRGGVLTAGTQLSPLPAEGLPEGAEAVFSANGAYLAYAGGAVYVRAAGAAGYVRSALAFARIPSAVRVYDGTAGEALLLSDGVKCALLTKSGLAEEAVPAFSAAAYAYERLWLVTGEQGGVRLRYSSFEDWRDFAEAAGGGGYLDVPDGAGSIAALVCFENAVYLFRAYGLQRLDARGDERAFAVRDVCTCARVYGESVAVCGGHIVWLGEDGLHAYNGSGAAPFAQPLSARLCGEQAAARGCAANGLYYLQADVRLAGGRVRALCSVGENGESFSLLAGSFTGLAGCGGQALAVYGVPCVLREGQAEGLCPRRAWECALQPPAGARLQRLCLDADAGFTLRVSGARGSRSFCVRRGGAQSFPVQLAGTKFRVRIEGGGACGQVRSLAAVWAYEEAEYDGK